MYMVYTIFMDEPRHMGIRDFRAEVTERVEAAHFRNEPTVVTKNGQPRAALVPYSWLKDMKTPKEQT
ncbi:type II toxin-antitoxin system prevent-host-death family antitoxin [Nocardiopsis synnemataformans]|uniref:type II toxin-antitoxin system prevent-host-death family antitoxin n=1 Tax=Nocardiopsis synnemataformans TaxID=61305 RepID=UPI003EBBD7CB